MGETDCCSHHPASMEKIFQVPFVLIGIITWLWIIFIVNHYHNHHEVDWSYVVAAKVYLLYHTFHLLWLCQYDFFLLPIVAASNIKKLRKEQLRSMLLICEGNFSCSCSFSFTHYSIDYITELEWLPFYCGCAVNQKAVFVKCGWGISMLSKTFWQRNISKICTVS